MKKIAIALEVEVEDDEKIVGVGDYLIWLKLEHPVRREQVRRTITRYEVHSDPSVLFPEKGRDI